MDDTPKAFLEEIRSSILKKRVGQIALAVVIAQAIWRLINSLVSFLILPLVREVIEGHTESVLYGNSARQPFPLQPLFGSLLEFGLTIVVVFYLNRWIHAKPIVSSLEDQQTDDLDESHPEGQSLSSNPASSTE